MRLRGLLSQLVVIVLLVISVATPVLLATLPTTNISAQTAVNTVEKSADNSIALGNLFKSCTVITLDTGYITNQSTLTSCLREVLAAIFLIAVLWLIITLAASMLGVVVRSGEGSDKGGPIAQTRRKLEKGLLGLVFLGAPYLLLSLFAGNLGSTELLYTGVDNKLIQGCYAMRRDFDAGISQSTIANNFKSLTQEFLTDKKNSTKTIVTLAGDYNEYSLNLKYILSDFCVGKIPVADFRQELMNSAKTAKAVKQARLASVTRKRAELATIVVKPVEKTEEEIEKNIQKTYESCRNDLPNIALYCEFVRVGAEVAGYEPKDTAQNVVERNRWVVFLGRLYEIGYPDNEIGNAITDALILSLKRGKLDVESTKTVVNTLKDFVTKKTYTEVTDPQLRELHLQRIAYAAQAVNTLLDQGPNLNGRIASIAVGFASTFIITEAPKNDIDRQFIALKAAVVGSVMTFLENGKYDDRTIVTTSFRTLTDALRAVDKNVEAEVVSVVGDIAADYMEKHEKEQTGDYKITQADYYEAAIDLGLYVVDIAVRTHRDQIMDQRLITITRIAGTFGKEVVRGEIACAQVLYQVKRNVVNAETSQLYLPSTSGDERAQYQDLYNKSIDYLKNVYSSLSISKASAEPSDSDLLIFMADEDTIRPGFTECKGVERSRIYRLTKDIAQAALPADVPQIAREAIDFVYTTVQLLETDKNKYSEAVKQDYIALGLMDLARSALSYIPQGDDSYEVARVLGATAVNLATSYLNGSIECKIALEGLKGKEGKTDWSGIYERYLNGSITNADENILRSRPDTSVCLGVSAPRILEAAFGTAQSIYRIVAKDGYDPRIAQLLDPDDSNSVAYLIIHTLQDAENGVKYPQVYVIRTVNVVANIINNFALNNDPYLQKVVNSVSNQVNILVGETLRKEISCTNAKEGKGGSIADCGGLNEYDFARSILAVVKSIVEIQGPGQQFFDTVMSTTEYYLGELQKQDLSGNEVAVGLLDIANSGVQAIITTLSNKTNLTQGDKDKLRFASTVAGKSFSIAENYFRGREVCDKTVADLELGIKKNTISNQNKLIVSRAVGYNLGINELGNAEFVFSNQDIQALEKVLEPCKNTIALEAANAVIDVVVEFVKIPGFPMAQAADLAKYLVESLDNNENYSNYKTAQYLVRLLAAAVSSNTCTATEGESQEASDARVQRCAVIASLVDFVDRSLQLYIDGKATSPNFAREILNLGQSIALALNADTFVVEKVKGLGDKLIVLWEKSISGGTQIFTAKTVGAEFLNFAGALLPYWLKTDDKTTEYIQMWTEVAANALVAPDAVNPKAILTATASYVASRVWQCEPKNGKPVEKNCRQNAAANTVVFMGVIDAINLGPVSQEKYINLCYDSVGNDVCGPKIEELIVEMQVKIGGGNQNAYRLANSYLYTKEKDVRVKPSQLGNSSFVFTSDQKDVLRNRVSVCDAATIPDEKISTTSAGEAEENDPALDYYDNNRDLTSATPQNPCMRNPMIQLTSYLSLDLDKMVDALLLGVSSSYGVLGMGENKIVTTLSKVAREIDVNRVIAGDNTTIGRTLVKNIGYILHNLPVEQVTGESAAVIIRIVGDLPWETIIYNPLALGGAECVPQSTQKTANAATFYPQNLAYNNRNLVVDGETFITSPIKGVYTAVAAPPKDIGVDKPNVAGRTPACTAALVTGVLSRIDFSLLFSALAGAENAGIAAQRGQFVNQLVGILDRMDYTCPLGQKLNNKDGGVTCDQSFGTVAKNIMSILGALDFSLLLDQKTATFIKSFIATFPSDVFTTGFTLAQMDSWVNLTALIADQLGVSGDTIKQMKEAYNDIVGVLKDVSGTIKTIDNVLKYVQSILDGLNALSIAGIKLVSDEARETLQRIVNDARSLILEIRNISDQFEQLKQVKLSFEFTVQVVVSVYSAPESALNTRILT